ncbi:23S rRNA pseudouridine synthase F [Thalassolituus oleivorans]|uniref:23S rRNA pseudouridine(2604) synthase RluF n=1 Tax=Thalassolituus oleivorans TaxID=187493 RepID=UPI0009493907|nr:23S rRNA pseudouridine(2604) synthase RluF [Thalassolituus oleivorans]APR66576.1 23S rRNA pseudouridine synthase F [Thalassolituus oleivorans]
MFSKTSIRLNKYISESGICSRRDADRFIEQGSVFINGRRATVGDQVGAGDEVKVNGQLIEPREEDQLVFIALNKPVGIVSTTESTEVNNIVDFVAHSVRIFPIGRLDKDSQGLIFLTSNGDLVNKILRAGNNHEKEYLVTVNRPITDDFIDGMSAGVPILGTKTKKCKVVKEAANVFRITLVQGLNRQIRRMCEFFDYGVIKLERVSIMNVTLKGLPVGEWRDLTEKELAVLFKAIESSSSEAPNPNAAKRKSPRAMPSAPSDGKPKRVAGSAKKPAGTKPVSAKETYAKTKAKPKTRKEANMMGAKAGGYQGKTGGAKTSRPNKSKGR